MHAVSRKLREEDVRPTEASAQCGKQLVPSNQRVLVDPMIQKLAQDVLRHLLEQPKWELRVLGQPRKLVVGTHMVAQHHEYFVVASIIGKRQKVLRLRLREIVMS